MKPTKILAAVFVLLLVVAGVAWNQRLALYDWWRLADYNPPLAIQQLAQETTMTPYATHLFYVYHPLIEGSADFNRDCSVTPQVTVLGCTVSFQGIYLYDVQDPQLNGLEQSTAAYEMLHVGYSRLSDSERTTIDALVLQAYKAALPGDPELGQEEASYLKTEGAGAVANELHSMVGTEVTNLPPALATYYAQYFSNRSAVLAYRNEYEAVFERRQSTVSTDDNELNSWKLEINEDESTLDSEETRLSQESGQLQVLLGEGQDQEYNDEVPGYNAAVADQNALANATKNLIASYNSLVNARNGAAIEVNQLYQTISSQPLSGAQPLTP